MTNNFLSPKYAGIIACVSVLLLGNSIFAQSSASQKSASQKQPGAPSSPRTNKSQQLNPTEIELQKRVTPKINKLDFRGALNEVNIMLAGDSTNTTLLNVKATLQMQTYNYTDAVASYGKIIALQPDNLYALQSRAQLRFEHLGDNQGAIQDWTRVIGIDSLNPSAWFARGSIYQANQNYADASKDYTNCLRIGSTDNIYALTQRGICSMKLKQIPDAMTDFTAAIKLADSTTARNTLFEAFFCRGSLHLQRRKYSESVFDLDAALRLNDQSGEAYYLRGYAKMLGGRTQEGCIDIAQAKELQYAGAEALLEQHCDMVTNLDSLRRYTMPTVTVMAKRSPQEIAITDSRRILSRVQTIVANPFMSAQSPIALTQTGLQSPPGMMSPFDCNKQRIEMTRPSQINIGCVAQILQDELRKVPDNNVRAMVNNIMDVANDLYVLETSNLNDTTNTTQSINNQQIMQIRIRLADQFRELNQYLEKLQPTKQ